MAPWMIIHGIISENPVEKNSEDMKNEIYNKINPQTPLCTYMKSKFKMTKIN